KPNHSYVVMCHEAIVASEEKALSLPQIYRAIERKYPYYKFRVTTNGWQSSVRHNLGQNKAFRKVERAGKGWMWGVVE
ncbi:fork head domain-containing protein, partial [Geopyxis carbonaria]